MEDESLLVPTANSPADVEEAEPKLQKKPSGHGLYPFHLSNIHERCLAANIVRAVPLAIFVLTLVVTGAGALFYPHLLLVTAAFFNVWMWLWLVSYAVSSIQATRLSQQTVVAAEKRGGHAQLVPVSESTAGAPAVVGAGGVVQLIVLPNYKEDISILRETLKALSQCIGSQDFRVVLAMEEREGQEKAQKKAAKLQEQFGKDFADLCAALHPLDLEELHLDGSTNAEVPGKSSNLKWAVNVGHQRCVKANVSLASVVLTVADADCIFHPNYFDHVGHEFRELCATGSEGAAGTQFPWTIWQAPQLVFRNYFDCAAPARIWGYMNTMYELGGIGGLVHAGFHMTFSSFSLPLALVLQASPWDGDVIADDHHCYLKCFLYSIYQKASEQTQAGAIGGIDPPLVVRPVMLPVKSTSVVADGCISNWAARFGQAKRHAQGIAEFPYVLLGVFNMLRTLPRGAYGWALICKLCKVVLLPFTCNMLPTCHTFPFMAVSLQWFANSGELPQCPSSLWHEPYNPLFYTCALAGGFNLVVPMIVPYALVLFSNMYMIDTCFVQPGVGASSLWHSEDGRLPTTLGSKRVTVVFMVAVDCVVLMTVVMAVYGFIPAVMAYWSVLVRGNRFDFVSAAKVAESEQVSTPQLDHALPQAIVGRPGEDDADVRLRQTVRSL